MSDKLRIKFDFFVSFAAILAFSLLVLENTVYLKPYAYIIGEINLGVGLIFILDVLLRFLASPDKKKHIAHNWFELIVFVPFFQLTRGAENTPFFVITRQAAIVVIFLSLVRRSDKFSNLLSLKPAQLMAATFALAIGLGTVLLMLPAATRSGVRTSLIDALFTATSATCVTGLVVKDTGTYFSGFGQTVILALIQVGGLGIMTFSVSLALILGKRMNMKQEAIMTELVDQSSLAQVKNLIVYVFKMTFIFELFGTLLLFLAWVGKTGGVLKTIYYSVFHSVSAFCNAGFSVFSDNLVGFRDDVSTNAIISGLIIFGGLGFMVIKDIQENLGSRLSFTIKRKSRLKVQTRIVIWTSLALIILGAGALFLFEKNALFAGLSVKSKILVSLFQSITSRTAGFNSCDIAGLSSASLLVMIILMFIGGSPGSTAGGIKTTTFSVLWATLVSEFKAKENVEMFKKTIPGEVIKKAIIIFFSSFILVAGIAAALLFLEKNKFADTLFETVSAFGTVGLSTGLTWSLSLKGKLILAILMFIGRLGPLTVGYALLKHRASPRYEYASEAVAVG